MRRVRQLPWALLVFRDPLFENTAYSFILLYIFLKITMKLLRKVGNLRTNSFENLFFKDHYEVGTKSGKYEIDSK